MIPCRAEPPRRCKDRFLLLEKRRIRSRIAISAARHFERTDLLVNNGGYSYGPQLAVAQMRKQKSVIICVSRFCQ